MVGGGSGGHITPLLAVARQLKQKQASAQVAVVSERRGVFNHLLEDNPEVVDKVYYINAGKFRRYYGESWLKRLFDIKTWLLNIRDIFKLLIGILESFWLLLRLRPNVIFIKGGYVGVPMGLASRLLRIPYVTHDSDAVPGLTNRLIAKKAYANAVGMPPENYPYTPEKIVYVGIPVTDDFLASPIEARRQKRHDLQLARNDFLLLITGGSNGAQRLDKIVHATLAQLMGKYPKLNVVHQVGKGNEELYADYPAHLHSRLRVAGFLRPLSEYIAAADAVIARAGATAITEIGLQQKPLIIVPSPYLSGGHQLKNAKVYAAKEAAIVIDEQEAIADDKILRDALLNILNSANARDSLATKLHSITRKDAAIKIAELLLNTAKKKRLEH